MIFRRRSDRDFADEIQAHIELETDRLRAQGVPEDAAPHLARRAFGNVTAAQEQFYARHHNLLLDTLLRDVRYALRGLARSPGYAVAAILALALGIGATTAIFSTVDEILFRPPDLPAPGRVVQVYSLSRKASTYLSSSYPDYLDIRGGARVFQSLAASVRLLLHVAAGSAARERMSVDGVSGNYFEMLGVPPLVGRALGAGDDALGAPPVAMIAEDLWRSRFAADPAAAGKTILIAGHPFVVVGVVPRRVAGLNLNGVSPPRVWIPLHATVLASPHLARVFASRSATWLVITGRLKPGVSIESAQAEVQTIAARVNGNRDLTAVVFPLSRSKFWPSYRNQIRTSLAGFAIAAGLVLLLACTNASNLLLGRALVRRRELAVRIAIGAGSGRIVRQLLTEGAVLGGLSGAASLLVAAGLMRLLCRFPDALGLPLAVDLEIESRTLAFCIALSVFTILLFALAPAFQAARVETMPALRGGGNVGSRGREQWLRGGLVALQAAFCMILLVGGGLYLRALRIAYATDLGFRADHLLTAAFSLAPPGRQVADQIWNAQQTLLQHLATTPGVVSATLSSAAILVPRPNAQVAQAAAPAQSVTATYEYVGRGFFPTLGIPFLEGQDFAWRGEDASGVAIVDRTLARSLSAGRSLVGQTISVEAPDRPAERFVVVGVVGAAKYGSFWAQPEPHFYVPAKPDDVTMGFLHVRTSAPPGSLAAPVRKLWTELMPLAPLDDVETAEQRVNAELTPQRVAGGILGAFAAVALILIAVGLYSVVAFSVAQRQRELGIRLALGARRGAIFATVLGKALVPALAGMAAGATISFPLMRIIAAKATNVSPHDLSTYVAVALVLLAVICVAALVPARRAMRIDPSITLRLD
jgi:putative ABC transport system permease protein